MSFGTFVKSARDVINTGLHFLPVFLAFTIFTVGITTWNISFILLFVGMFAVLPLGVILFTYIFRFTPIPLFKSTESLFPIVEAAAKNANSSNNHISFGFSMLIFLFTYLIANAAQLIKTNEEPEIRGRASMSIAIVSIVAIIYFVSHILKETPETGVGIGVLTILGISLGVSWFYMMDACGKSIADVYGVENNKYVTEESAALCVVSN